MTKSINPAINGLELLQQQKKISTENIELGGATLNRCSPMLALKIALLPLGIHEAKVITLGLVRQELIGAIVARDPREYDDTPEAAVYLADDLLTLFHIASRAD